MNICENTTVKVSKRNWGEEVNVIEMIFNGKSKEEWYKITEEAARLREELVFIYKNKIISLVAVTYKIENGYSTIYNSSFTIQELNEIVLNLKNNIKYPITP